MNKAVAGFISDYAAALDAKLAQYLKNIDEPIEIREKQYEGKTVSVFVIHGEPKFYSVFGFEGHRMVFEIKDGEPRGEDAIE